MVVARRYAKILNLLISSLFLLCNFQVSRDTYLIVCYERQIIQFLIFCDIFCDFLVFLWKTIVFFIYLFISLNFTSQAKKKPMLPKQVY